MLWKSFLFPSDRGDNITLLKMTNQVALLSPDQTVTTFISTFSQHLLRADVEAVWHPSQQCREMLWHVETSLNSLNFVSTSSQHFVLEMLRGCWGRLTGHGLNISQHDTTNVERMLRPRLWPFGWGFKLAQLWTESSLEETHVWGNASLRSSSLAVLKPKPK